MAKEKDISRRPKFFVRKRGIADEQLCDRCRHHNYVVMVKYGCDALILTDTNLKVGIELNDAAETGKYLHLWCVNEDEAPECLEHFREVRAVQ